MQERRTSSALFCARTYHALSPAGYDFGCPKGLENQMKIVLSICTLLVAACFPIEVDAQEETPLFNGTFEGWEGDTENTWRIENGAIVAGSLETAAPRNEFLTTTQTFSDFDLQLKFKTNGTEKINCGVQFRTARLRARDGTPQHEVIGYQADIGENVHGYLYDESRRKKFLAKADETTDKKIADAIPADGWQTYRIQAVGNRIQLWLNGIQTVDYTETDASISKKGVIALQIHGNMVGTIAYKDIVIKDLGEPRVSIDDMAWIAGHWKGEAFGGKFEETWNAPMGGEMMGMFKLVNDDKVSFYEIMTIVPEKDSYVLRLKHFSPGLVSWEEKDDSVEFPLVSASNNAVHFYGLKFSKVSENAMTIEVVVGDDGKQKVVKFNCTRAQK